MSLLIRDCIVVNNHKASRTCVHIDKGKIVSIGKMATTDQVYDARGKVLLPGIIDPHVHFREPGGSEKENWESGAMAAVSSGVTTVLDMPNTNPPTTTAEDIARKRQYADGHLVNFGFHLGVTPQNAPLLHKMRGFAGAKLYMGATTGNLLVEDESVLYEAISSKALIVLHAEDGRLVQYLIAKHEREPLGQHSVPSLHNLLRPNLCAELALAKAITIAKHTKGRLVVAHLSTREEVELVRRAKREAQDYGFEIYAEVSPHHLFLTEDSVLDGSGKVNPPLRTRKDCDALWGGIYDGTIDMLGSDHAPHMWKDKQLPYAQMPSGISGIETTLPLMLDAAHHKKITLTQLMRISAENVARVFGLKDKGKIAPGYDADLVLVDMDAVHAISGLNFHSLAKFTPFETRTCKGWPIATFVQGELAWEKLGDEEKFYIPHGREVVYERAD